jgi:uncharacterized integral membrane protein
MKFFSSLLTLLLLVFALVFALNNRQNVTISLWPFGVEVVVPLYLLALGTLFLGLVVGGITGWVSHLPHRIEARRLRRDIAGLRDKIEDLHIATPPVERLEWHGESPPSKPKKRFWARFS